MNAERNLTTDPPCIYVYSTRHVFNATCVSLYRRLTHRRRGISGSGGSSPQTSPVPLSPVRLGPTARRASVLSCRNFLSPPSPSRERARHHRGRTRSLVLSQYAAKAHGRHCVRRRKRVFVTHAARLCARNL